MRPRITELWRLMHVGIHVIVTYAAVVSTLVVNDHRHGAGICKERRENSSLVGRLEKLPLFCCVRDGEG
jgi:hypothetical protein